MMKTIRITKNEMNAIRAYDDFALKMFLSEIHDNGWPSARMLMKGIALSIEADRKRGGE